MIGRLLGHKAPATTQRYAVSSSTPPRRQTTKSVKRYRGRSTNNGRIAYSVRQAADELHISTATASRALKRLQERGFIVIQTLGSFNFKASHATEWRLTEYQCDVSNQLAAKDFMRWGAKKQKPVSVVKPLGVAD